MHGCVVVGVPCYALCSTSCYLALVCAIASIHNNSTVCGATVSVRYKSVLLWLGPGWKPWLSQAVWFYVWVCDQQQSSQGGILSCLGLPSCHGISILKIALMSSSIPDDVGLDPTKIGLSRCCLCKYLVHEIETSSDKIPQKKPQGTGHSENSQEFPRATCLVLVAHLPIVHLSGADTRGHLSIGNVSDHVSSSTPERLCGDCTCAHFLQLSQSV